MFFNFSIRGLLQRACYPYPCIIYQNINSSLFFYYFFSTLRSFINSSRFHFILRDARDRFFFFNLTRYSLPLINCFQLVRHFPQLCFPTREVHFFLARSCFFRFNFFFRFIFNFLLLLTLLTLLLPLHINTSSFLRVSCARFFFITWSLRFILLLGLGHSRVHFF